MATSEALKPILLVRAAMVLSAAVEFVPLFESLPLMESTGEVRPFPTKTRFDADGQTCLWNPPLIGRLVEGV
jgi:hypothetical protein